MAAGGGRGRGGEGRGSGGKGGCIPSEDCSHVRSVIPVSCSTGISMVYSQWGADEKHGERKMIKEQLMMLSLLLVLT